MREVSLRIGHQFFERIADFRNEPSEALGDVAFVVAYQLEAPDDPGVEVQVPFPPDALDLTLLALDVASRRR